MAATFRIFSLFPPTITLKVRLKDLTSFDGFSASQIVSSLALSLKVQVDALVANCVTLRSRLSLGKCDKNAAKSRVCHLVVSGTQAARNVSRYGPRDNAKVLSYKVSSMIRGTLNGW
jgi:hypothetical protein